jgi:predicted phosphoribosyltransferase
MKVTHFRNRAEAGALLTALLEPLVQPPIVVAAIPRGGLTVALPIAARFHAPLTVAFARKLTVPAAPEFALGAVDEDGVLLLDRTHAESVGATPEELDQARRAAHLEIARERERYRAVPLQRLAPGAAVVLVDDGLATGLTMRAAVAHARRCGAREVIVAAPCASHSAARRLQEDADRVVALTSASGPFAVGGYYDDFRSVSDAEAVAILEQAQALLESEPPGPSAGSSAYWPPVTPADEILPG